MRKLVWAVLLVMILSAAFVLAVEQNITKAVPCTDSDNGPGEKNKADPYIGVLGFVKYGISTDKSDECVSNKEGFHKDPSIWVREYFCAGSPVMLQHEDYDCTHYGYTSCQGGKCIGKSNATTVSHTTATEPACGNHKLDAGEKCDPPDKICYDGSKVGICSRPNPTTHFGGCQCNIYEKGTSTTSSGTTAAPAEKPPVEQPPVTVPPVVQPPAAEQPPSAPPATAQPPAETTTQPERQPLPIEELPPAKGIGVTRAITNSVKHFFSWIGSWFH